MHSQLLPATAALLAAAIGLNGAARAPQQQLPDASAQAGGAAGLADAPAVDRSKSSHGAMAMDAQERALDALGVARDGMTPPASMDPVVYASLVPADNAPTAERVALGRKLYFDQRLSKDGTVSCATCHDVSRGFTDQRPVSEGIGDQLGRRNAPTTMNAALYKPQFWDGRARDVDHQAQLPIQNSVEMGQQTEAEIVARLRNLPEYASAFREAYGHELTYVDVGNAIGAFERTLVFLDAPLERFLAGDESALDEDAKAGWVLYNGKARCAGCHPINAANPLGSDFEFHNIGVSARAQDFEQLAAKALAVLEQAGASDETLDELALTTDLTQLGRFVVTRNYSDVGSFKTPQLRNVGLTAPYMHDGTLQTLWDVMDHYNRGGEANLYLDGGIEALALSEEEIDQLVALMFAMTDVRFAEQNQRAFEKQKARAAEQRPFRDDDLAQRRTLVFERHVLGGDRTKGK